MRKYRRPLFFGLVFVDVSLAQTAGEKVQPLHPLMSFERRVARRTHGLVHGPMLGAVTPHSVRLWVRTEEEGDFEVRIARGWDLLHPVASARGETRPADDYTGVVEIADSSPAPNTPVASLEIVNIDGETVWRRDLPLAELTKPSR